MRNKKGQFVKGYDKDRKGFQKGHKHSEETRRKIGEGHLGKKHSEGHKEKIGMAMRNRKHTWGDKIGLAIKGKKHSQKTKDKMSLFWKRYLKENPQEIERLKKQRAKQIFPIKDTSIEIKIQNFLKQLGIEFFTHQYIKIKHGYQCDILIPSMNLVIECDGDYWHKYPIGTEIDHIRTKELIKKGFKVLRLWEFEINEMTINNFKKRCKMVV